MGKTPSTRWRSARKWIWRGALAGFGLALLALVSVPFWLGGALRKALPDDLIQFESYERVGYGRFTLSGVEVVSPQAQVKIDSLEAYSPAAWAWNAMAGDAEIPFLSVGTVELEILNTQSASKSEAAAGPRNLLEALESAAEPLGLATYWAPHVSVDVVEARYGEDVVTIRELLFRENSLSLKAQASRFSEYNFELLTELAADGPSLSLRSSEAELSVLGKMTVAPEAADISVNVEFKGNKLEGSARFDQSGWIPVEGRWSAPDWDLTAQDIGVSGPYSQFTFNLDGDWDGAAYRSEVSGAARPSEDEESAFPSVEFGGSVAGDLESLLLESFQLGAPGVEARVTDPVRFSLSELNFDGEMRLDLDFDLSLLRQESLSGTVSGGAILEANQAGLPVGRFSLVGEGVSFEELNATELVAEASLDWPQVDVDSLSVVLDSGSRIRAAGGIDVEELHVVPTQIEVDLSDEVTGKLAPEGMAVKTVSVSSAIEGPLDALAHSGVVSVGSFETEALKPLSLGLEWSGNDRSFEALELEAGNGSAQLSFAGSSVWEEERVDLAIKSFELIGENGSLASLGEPARVGLEFGESLAGAIESLDLVGAQSKIEIAATFSYPERAQASVALSGLDTRGWIDPWLKEPLPEARIDSLSISAAWDEGPVEAEGVIDASVVLEEGELGLDGKLSMLDRSVTMEAFAISDLEGPLLSLEGELPYEVDPEVEGFLVASPSAPLSFSMETSNSPTIIALLDSVLPLPVETLEAQAELGGSLSDPRGRFDLNLRTKAGEGEHGAPPMSLAAKAKIEKAALEVEELVAEVLDQRFEALMEVAFPESVLSLLALEPADVDWGATQIEFSAPETSLAPVAFFVPQLLAPGGVFESRLSGSPTDGFSGFVRIDGLNTRPIFPFGSFRNVRTRLELDRAIATLQEFNGDIGREPMRMTGEINFEDLEDLAFSFEVEGADLPIMRQAGLLLRSDLDVVASKKNGEAAKIGGEVVVKEGLFLLDTTVLTASGGGGQSAESRPPYFSVDVDPFKDWELDLAVKGERFMRLQTPAANGVLSMDMALTGTLGEPLSTGRVEFDEGDLVFPFASFGLTEGLIELRVDDPYTPMLSLIGETRRFRYDLGIEITGSAFDPNIRFTSSPPLSSEQILLMVMAGDVPDANFNYSASQRASKIGTYLSQGLLSSGSEGGLGSRFSLVTGENLSEQGKETLEMEFKLDERFQLLGEYDEYDAWNTGLRWRVLRRRPKENNSSEAQEVTE